MKGRDPLAVGRRPSRHALPWTSARIAIMAVLAACGHEAPDERPRYNLARLDSVPRLYAGPVIPRDSALGPYELAARNPNGRNVYAMQEGYHLWQWMNCKGCHGDGGGGIGPALWDDEWIYGGSAAAIAETILRGRPNGMPAFAGRLSEEQLWKLVTYVETLEPGGGMKRAGAK